VAKLEFSSPKWSKKAGAGHTQSRLEAQWPREL
jgi:hypothetical protein